MLLDKTASFVATDLIKSSGKSEFNFVPAPADVCYADEEDAQSATMVNNVIFRAINRPIESFGFFHVNSSQNEK